MFRVWPAVKGIFLVVAVVVVWVAVVAIGGAAYPDLASRFDGDKMPTSALVALLEIVAACLAGQAGVGALGAWLFGLPHPWAYALPPGLFLLGACFGGVAEWRVPGLGTPALVGTVALILLSYPVVAAATARRPQPAPAVVAPWPSNPA